MQKFIIIAILTSFLSFCQCSQDLEISQEIVKKQLTVSVPTIHCKSCLKKIEAGLIKLDGILKVSPNLQEKKFTIEFDPVKISNQKIAEEIKKFGHDSNVINETTLPASTQPV